MESCQLTTTIIYYEALLSYLFVSTQFSVDGNNFSNSDHECYANFSRASPKNGHFPIFETQGVTMDPNCVNVMYCPIIDMYYDEVSYGWDDNCIQN